MLHLADGLCKGYVINRYVVCMYVCTCTSHGHPDIICITSLVACSSLGKDMELGILHHQLFFLKKKKSKPRQPILDFDCRQPSVDSWASGRIRRSYYNSQLPVTIMLPGQKGGNREREIERDQLTNQKSGECRDSWNRSSPLQPARSPLRESILHIASKRPWRQLRSRFLPGGGSRDRFVSSHQ